LFIIKRSPFKISLPLGDFCKTLALPQAKD
jgi:hypothetical protein